MQKEKIWEKRVIYEDLSENMNGATRYEYILEPYTIDVTIGKDQNFPGSNQVNVFSKYYGGWLLGTPKNFKNKAEVEAFIKSAKKKLEEGKEGEKVEFPRD